MDHVVVKIESTYITLAHIKKSGGSVRVFQTKRASLPESLCGTEAAKQPELLAYTIVNELHSAAFPAVPLAIYLGAGTELFVEYRYSETLDDAMKNQRKQQAESALLEYSSAPVCRVKYYPYDGREGGLAASMVLAVDADFCDQLVSFLAKDGYTASVVSSSLVAFAETAKSVAKLGDRVLVVCAEKQDSQIALFMNGRLARLARFAQGTEAKNPESLFLPFITSETDVVLCGPDTKNSLLLRRLKKAEVASVSSVSAKALSPHGRISLSGDLAYQDKLLPEAFAMAAFPGEEGESAYFAKERDKKRSGIGLRAALIVIIIAVLFACALPAATLYLAERDTEANRSRLNEPFFADAAMKLEEYRGLITVYAELMETEENMPARDQSHADLLEEMLFGLLLNSHIEEMYYEKGKGILVDLTTENIEYFDMMKDVAGRGGTMFLYESKTREETDEGVWHIQIRVSLSQSASEVK